MQAIRLFTIRRDQFQILVCNQETIGNEVLLDKLGCSYSEIGHAGDYDGTIELRQSKKRTISIPLQKARSSYENLDRIMKGYYEG